MRQRAKSRPTAQPQPPAPPEVEELLRQADVSAADRLRDIAEGTDKAASKAARKALYQLRTQGIEPTPREAVQPAPTPRSLTYRSILTNVGGTGSRMLMFVREDPHGGSPYFSTFLVHDAEGILEGGTRKLPRKKLDENLQNLTAKGSTVVADIPLDYGRWLFHQAYRRSTERRQAVPDGTLEAIPHIGEPERDYPVSPVYDYVDAESVRSDLSISRAPEALFKNQPFVGWLLEAEEVEPWEEKYFKSQQSVLALDQAQLARVGDHVIDEATDDLMGGGKVALYRRRFEDTALVLHLADRTEDARAAIYHALSMTEDRLPHDIPIVRFLVHRSILVVTAMKAEQEEEEEQAQTSGGRIIRPG